MNIIIIGVTGVGKSTVGRELAKKMKFKFYDMDDYIEKRNREKIPAMFAKSEAYFRRKELQAAKELSRKKKIVLATGGGAVLQDELMQTLKKSGIIVLLYRPAHEILKKLDLRRRPLLKGNPEKLYEIMEERAPLYNKYGEIVVRNEGQVNTAVKRIMDALEVYQNENHGDQWTKS